MKMINNIHLGIFSKLAIAFIIVGLIPMLAISCFFYSEFTNNIESVLLNDAATMLNSGSEYVDTLLGEWDDKTKMMYSINLENGIFLGDVILNSSISNQEKSIYIKRFLGTFKAEKGLVSIRFLDQDGNLYYISEVVGKVIDANNIEVWKNSELANLNNEKEIQLSATHQDNYFANVNEEVITVKRNLFDVTSVKSVEHRIGTIYLDFSKSVIEEQLSKANLGNKSGFYIIDDHGQEVYRSANQKAMNKTIWNELYSEMSKGKKYIEDENAYYLYQHNLNGNWINVIKVHKDDIINNTKQTTQYIITILLTSSIILTGIYFLFSKRITIPILNLKKGMKRIQDGDLTTRVAVRSHDEIGILAEGLNQMAAQLSEYIERVYGAEIKQRDAELNALKSQIKPHYLYNTLDVIRMTAINNDDRQTARMVESLASQLRYLIGNSNDTVTVGDELKSIEDYFEIIKVRYEGRIELKINAPERLLELRVLKLILQPAVENAIKHGFKMKMNQGMIWVTVLLKAKDLVFTIMDNGIGMTNEELRLLQHNLEVEEINQNSNGGVGLHNVKERIRRKYGTDYGIDVQSSLGKGTIVIIRIPYLKEDNNAESNSD